MPFFCASLDKLIVAIGVLSFCGLISTPISAQTRQLNDTGITFSGSASGGNSATCRLSDPASQDCRHGRDSRALAGTLTKVGGSGGTNGFDFTKVCNSGQIAGSGGCPANPTVPGYGTNEWGCTKDNLTGLLWEVKTTSGVRSMYHSYTWFKTSSPDGNSGYASGGFCATPSRCDTEKYVEDVNSLSTALCGHRDWRMPSIKELEGIVDFGRPGEVAIDPTYFPNSTFTYVWSDSPIASDSSSVWTVYFEWGYASRAGGNRSTHTQVRLVRGRQ